MAKPGRVLCLATTRTEDIAVVQPCDDDKMVHRSEIRAHVKPRWQQ